MMLGEGLNPDMGGNKGSRCMPFPNPGGIWGSPGGNDIAPPMGGIPNGLGCEGIDLDGIFIGDAE
jgi:hypothetical protein